MHIQPVILPILLQALTSTTALVIDITHPTSLSQDHNTNTDTAPHLQPSNISDRYYVECEHVTYPRHSQHTGLNPSNCLSVAPIICDLLSKLRPASLVTEKWLWASQTGCALGYYLPEGYEHRTEEIPGKEECIRDIYGMIIERCASRSQYNVGSINVEQLPMGREVGLAMTEGYPRYVMAPRRL